MRDVYIILGAPGSGKLTQAKLLSKKLKLDFISLGQTIYKQRINKNYPYFFEKSEKASNSSISISRVISYKIKEIKKNSKKKGLVICGYPRRESEAKKLVTILKKLGFKVKCVINLNISLETIIGKRGKNYICQKCGTVYNQVLKPKIKGKCDKDSGTLIKEKINIKESREEFIQSLKENKGAYSFLKKIADFYFTVSGDEKELDVFSNIILKIKNETRECFTVYKKQSSATLETKYGVFEIISYLSIVDYTFHLVLVKGRVKNKFRVLTRVHSSCITGDIFSSLRCDCGMQLSQSMKLVQKEDSGIIVYLFQEGRGINIVNKINTYALQQKGLDTFEANEKLGLPAEMRQYGVVKDILEDLGVKTIRLLTNNPDKISKMTELGIAIEKREPIEIKPTNFDKRYLITKKNKMKHKLHVV